VGSAVMRTSNTQTHIPRLEPVRANTWVCERELA